MRTMIKPNQCHGPSNSKSFFDEMLDTDFFHLLQPVKNRSVNIPAVNIKENELQYEFSFAIPGMKKEDFKISFEKNVLTVAAEGKKETEVQKEEFVRKEFGYAEFKRSFNLGEKEIDQEKIYAAYTDGILNIILPKKTEQETASKMIEVK